ncbi:hypothetical protein LG651_04000 [Tamlana sp. 62-3]|uniref:Secretion system C-terminal sorting domain-containing protein n=1 Tax=Neotamlana sargassicola TaxID=2883125 RepID=A0A9X1I4Z2_9FLAO|nr:hypothetical protein [Tamlana sargassicola]MCB4807403.1 hypothetical protein [Tamlana sargassicola]
MKNVIKNTKKGFLMVTMFATLLSFATEPANLIIVKDAKKTILTLDSVKEGNLLTIIDANGVVLYKEVIAKTGNYQKAFDLTALPDGEYVFELEKDLEIDTMPFTVTDNQVVFHKASEKITYKPFLRVENGVVFVSKLSLNKSPLKVEIYYGEDSNLVFSESIENTKNIQKAYKLSGLGEGSYKFVFTTEGKTFTEQI